MSKTPSDKLHRLVRSLSAPEKRYFRIFIRGKTERDSKYLQLFEALASMEEFNEEEVKKQVYKNRPVPERTVYPQLKAYLYNLVIKCLQTFDEQHSTEHRLNQMLQGVAYTRMDADYLHKNLDQLLFDEQRVLEQMRNAADYRKAFFQVYATTLQRASQHRGEGQARHLQSIVNQEVFSNPDLAISHKARVMYYRTLNIYHYGALQFDAFYETGKTLIALLESQPHFLRESLSDYIAALSNLILSCGLLRKYDEVRECLQKLRSLQPITEDDRRKIHRQYFNNLFVLCIYTGEFAEAHQEIAAGHARQVLRLLRRGAGLAQDARGHRHQQPVGGERRKAARQFLAEHRTGGHVGAAAAELDRHRQPHPAQLGEALPDLARDPARAVHLADALLGQFPFEKVAHAVAQHLVFFDAIEIHVVSPSVVTDSPR